MLEVFAENLETAWKREAWRGLARAWAAVIHDVVGIIVPYRSVRALPLLLAVICSIAVYGAMLVAVAPNPHCMK